jgi:hypothetical protein
MCKVVCGYILRFWLLEEENMHLTTVRSPASGKKGDPNLHRNDGDVATEEHGPFQS